MVPLAAKLLPFRRKWHSKEPLELREANSHEISDPKPPIFPLEIWLTIGQYLDSETLQQLRGLNHALWCLAMDARYRSIRIDACNRFEALGYLYKLFKHIRTSEDFVGPRVKHIYATDDILQGFLLHRKRVHRHPYVYELRTRHGLFRRLRGMVRESQLTPRRIQGAFKHCTNVESLELVFNGPWFVMNKRRSVVFRCVYAMDSYIDGVLGLLCGAFQETLKVLQIRMHNAAHVRRVLPTPALAFSNLQVLDLNLANYARNSRAFDHEFAAFIARYSKTLRELRLQISHLGPDFLQHLFSHPEIIPEFPHLHTLLLFDYEDLLDMPREYKPVSNFLKRTPVLRNFHLAGPSPKNYSHIDIHDEIVLPATLALTTFGTDRFSWKLHGTSMSRLFHRHVAPQKLVFYHETHPSVFSGVFGANSFLNSITELDLKAMQLPILGFIAEIAQLFPAVRSIRILCGYIMIPEHGVECRGLPSNSLTNEAGALLLQAVPAVTESQPSNTVLTELDIVRSTSFPSNRPLCSCPEVRLWGVMKVLMQLYPSLRMLGGISADLCKEGFIDADFGLCERCQNSMQLS